MSETPHEEPRLFDLPLESSTEPSSSQPSRRRRGPAEPEPPERLPLFEEDAELDAGPGDELDSGPYAAELEAEPAAMPARPRPVPPPGPSPPLAALAPRIRGALGDVAVLASVGVLAIAGARALETPVGWAEAPGVLGFLLSWSFVYFVVALAFWGQTPGMAWAGVVARTPDDEPLSFGQTARRWAATWLTWALAGLPGLLALTGRSLADRMSGSLTFELEAAEASGELAA